MSYAASRAKVTKSSPKTKGPLSSLQTKLPTQDDARNERKLLLSMDYGTKTLSLAWRIAVSGDTPNPLQVWDIHFQQDYQAPQQVAWAQDGTFYWGHYVARALEARKIQPEDVIELWKLLLYEDHASSRLAQRVKKQLGKEHSLGELISTHLRAVISEAKEIIKLTPTFTKSTKDIDDLPMQLFLSVPQMWKPPANRIMTLAAKEAGVEYIELVYEPQCAAAYYTYHIKEANPTEHHEGDIILVADIGGGTGDFVSYEFMDDSTNGATVALKSVGNATGALCGSEFVNQNFRTWLEGLLDFETRCQDLALSKTACVKQGSEDFEIKKEKFHAASKEPTRVLICGTQKAKEKYWVVIIPRDKMAEFFDQVICKITQCIEDQLKDKTKILIIPGGFGQSEYLRDKLQERFGEQLTVCGQLMAAFGANQPVSRGALLRYSDVIVRGLPSREAFGIGQVEVYDPKIHNDATYFAGTLMDNGRICKKDQPNRKFVGTDPNDGSLIVYERWCSIMQKGTSKALGQAFNIEVWQHYMIPVQDRTISTQVYWTEEVIPEDDPILTAALGDITNVYNASIRPEIERWGPPLTKQLPDLDALGFEKKLGNNGWVYEVYGRLMVEGDGANIGIKWQIALPGTQPYDATGRRQYWGSLWEQKFLWKRCDDEIACMKTKLGDLWHSLNLEFRWQALTLKNTNISHGDAQVEHGSLGCIPARLWRCVEHSQIRSHLAFKSWDKIDDHSNTSGKYDDDFDIKAMHEGLTMLRDTAEPSVKLNRLRYDINTVDGAIDLQDFDQESWLDNEELQRSDFLFRSLHPYGRLLVTYEEKGEESEAEKPGEAAYEALWEAA